MEQREELISRSQDLESAVAQLKAKDGQFDYCNVFHGTDGYS